MSFPRVLTSATLAAWIAFTAPAGVAREVPQALAAAPVEVDGVDVEQVAELAAGVPLRFTLFGSARALAVLRIEGVAHPVELRETEPGVYEGQHVIDPGDAIRPDSRVTASLQRDGRIASATLDEPLMLERRAFTWGAGSPAPVRPDRSPRPGAPVGSLQPAPARAAPDPCDDCARVESVRAVDAPRGGPIGSAARAVAEAILGKEAGEAHNRRMLGLFGALAGRPAEPSGPASFGYDVVLRRPDGSSLVRRYEQAPPFTVGETIRIGARPERREPAPGSL